MASFIMSPKSSYAFSFLYMWAFPLMVPLFAISFGVFDIRWIWKLEEMFYKTNSNDRFLFDHFDRVKLNSLTTLLYRGHPFFAGISLLLSYALIYTDNRYPSLIYVYLLTSTMMAAAGGMLVRKMYGNALAKWWTKTQSWLVCFYNSLMIVSIITRNQALQKYCFIFSFSLLVCAGIFERAYVLFVLPLFGISNRDTYLIYYSYQFKAATLGSWILGIAYILKYSQ